MRKTSLVLAALLAVVGVCVMLWPVFTGHRLQADTDAAVQEFLAEHDEPEQHPKLLAALQVYNQRIYVEKQSGLVDLEACEEPAASLLAYGIDDEIIGVLEIPTMELTMPVYQGVFCQPQARRHLTYPDRRGEPVYVQRTERVHRWFHPVVQTGHWLVSDRLFAGHHSGGGPDGV